MGGLEVHIAIVGVDIAIVGSQRHDGGLEVHIAIVGVDIAIVGSRCHDSGWFGGSYPESW